MDRKDFVDFLSFDVISIIYSGYGTEDLYSPTLAAEHAART